MSHIGDYGFASRNAAVAPPLLVECNRQGQVIWLSPAARLAFGDAGNLVDAFRGGREETVRFSLVLESGDRVLINAQIAGQAEDAGQEEVFGLRNLQDNLVRHCFRLQDAERSLSTRARQMRPAGGGRLAIQQVERERERLGRDLHTGVGQLLVAIKTQLENILAELPAPPQPVQQAIDRISQLVADALQQVRDISRKLHPPEWLRLTLEEALRQMWEMSGIPQRYQSSALRLEPLPHDPDLELKTLMYRGAQEALSNLTQHSQATDVRMTLDLTGERLMLSVADNGVGFDAERQLSAPAKVGSGIGLRSIREQARSLGGDMVIESGVAGTRLQVWVPFSAGPA